MLEKIHGMVSQNRFVPNWRADTVASALVAILSPWQEAGKRKTIPAGNGKEFAGHALVAELLHADFYFAAPYLTLPGSAVPTNISMGGLLRRFFPKGTDFAQISRDALANATMLIDL
jgi:IS30 family transposase